MLDKGMIHMAGRTEREGARFHHTPQNGAQHKIYELLSFGIFHLLFSDWGWEWVTETMAVCLPAQSLCSIWLSWDPKDCSLSLPGSSNHGILQARILDWFAISFSRGSSWPRDRTHISCSFCIGRRVLYPWATWEAGNCSYGGGGSPTENRSSSPMQEARNRAESFTIQALTFLFQASSPCSVRCDRAVLQTTPMGSKMDCVAIRAETMTLPHSPPPCTAFLYDILQAPSQVCVSSPASPGVSTTWGQRQNHPDPCVLSSRAPGKNQSHTHLLSEWVNDPIFYAWSIIKLQFNSSGASHFPSFILKI